jgi:predicted NUDIX family NTP pyrophosphohydrolase
MRSVIVSAGIVLYQRTADGLQVLLAHPGGPFWQRKDAGAWSIPKGEIGPGEAPEAAALREFAEETGVKLALPLQALGEVKQKGGKRVIAFACESPFDVAALRSNTFTLEWPPRSGRQQEFPEIDRAAWFDLDTAREKILTGQRPLLDALEQARSV